MPASYIFESVLDGFVKQIICCLSMIEALGNVPGGVTSSYVLGKPFTGRHRKLSRNKRNNNTRLDSPQNTIGLARSRVIRACLLTPLNV